VVAAGRLAGLSDFARLPTHAADIDGDLGGGGVADGDRLIGYAPDHGSGCSGRAHRLLRPSVVDGGRERDVPVPVGVAIPVAVFVAVFVAVPVAVTIDDPNGPEGDRGARSGRPRSGE
jgi:hypothetical protein